MYSDTDYAWAAGFFDGEGTININKQGGSASSRGSFQQYIGATQVRPAPIERLVEMFGGSAHMYAHRASSSGRPYWVWRLQGCQAIHVALSAMLPYLLVKKDEAELMIQWCENVFAVGTVGRRGYTEEEIAYRSAMVQTMMVLR